MKQTSYREFANLRSRGAHPQPPRHAKPVRWSALLAAAPQALFCEGNASAIVRKCVGGLLTKRHLLAKGLALGVTIFASVRLRSVFCPVDSQLLSFRVRASRGWYPPGHKSAASGYVHARTLPSSRPLVSTPPILHLLLPLVVDHTKTRPMKLRVLPRLHTRGLYGC